MRILFCLVLFISLSFARENPFIQTQSYKNEVKNNIKKKDAKLKKKKEEQEALNFKKAKLKAEQTTKKLELEKKALKAKKIKAKKLKNEKSKAQKRKEKKRKEKKRKLKKKIAKKARKSEKTTGKMKIIQSEKAPFKTVGAFDPIAIDKLKIGSYQMLPSLNISFTDNTFFIHTKYQVYKKFVLENEKKIVLDFKAHINFYTKRNALASKDFKYLTIGSHKGGKYLRIVLRVTDNPNNFKVGYNDKGVIIEK